MTLYTSKVIAQWLCLTERRVRQLRDEGVIVEARPGLYELQPTVARYIKYLGGAGKESLNTERMKLTAEKRKAAEMDNDLRRGDLHSTQDIEKGIQTMCLNIRSRFLAMPAKLSPTLAAMDGNQAAIFDEMKKAIDETLEELSDYRVAYAERTGVGGLGRFFADRVVQKGRNRAAHYKYKKVKKNKSASRAPAGESIEQRPEEIDGREEFGHWEGDTVYSGKGKRKTTRALLTLTERKTRKEIIIAIPNRKAETVVKALDALERKLGARRFRAIFKSITFDNGTEFAAAEELERSCVNKHLPRTKVYFCHPYSSWERGTNENTNGMIRRRFPKGTNFAAVTNAQIVQAENWINNYPRKILGYKSSEIVFRECLRELGIAA